MKNRWMVFTVVGFEIAASVAAGLFAGDYADARFGFETPYMTLAGITLGAGGGMFLLVRTLRRFG